MVRKTTERRLVLGVSHVSEDVSSISGDDRGQRDYHFRIYNPAVGRFLSVNPAISRTKSYDGVDYPSLSSMQLLADLRFLQESSIGLQKSDKEINRGRQGVPQYYQQSPETYASSLKLLNTKSSAGARGVGVLVLADFGLQVGQAIELHHQSFEDRKHLDLIRNSLRDVSAAIKAGWINGSYLNISDVSKLADFVLRGTHIEDFGLRQVGIRIVKEISKNYRDVLDSEITIPSGLDNYQDSVLPYNSDLIDVIENNFPKNNASADDGS